MAKEKIRFKNTSSMYDIMINIEKAIHPVPGTEIPVQKNSHKEKDYTAHEKSLIFKIAADSGTGGDVFLEKIETEHEYEVEDIGNMLRLKFKNITEIGPSHGDSTTNVEVGVNDTQPTKPEKPPKQKKS